MNIGDKFMNDKIDLEITDMLLIKNSRGNFDKRVKYTCNICGFSCGEHYKKGELHEEYTTLQENIERGHGCACCCPTPRIVVAGINDINTTNPEIEKFFLNKDDLYKYSKSSNIKVETICPDCNRVGKSMYIGKIYVRKSIGCECGDYFSYPEKFTDSVLSQLGVVHKMQLNKSDLSWCRNYKYDFLINNSIIVETHGKQHYEKSNRGKTLVEEQKNDMLKKELALANGIEEYIVIDCRESNAGFIKNNILNSKLSELYDLSNVDWNKAGEYAMSNLSKKACDLWNTRMYTSVSDIAHYLKVSNVTVGKWLKKWVNIGMCDYDPKKAQRESWNRNVKKVEVFKNGLSVGVFESCVDVDIKSMELFGVKLDKSNISRVCTGVRNSHQGFTFKYAS